VRREGRAAPPAPPRSGARTRPPAAKPLAALSSAQDRSFGASQIELKHVSVIIVAFGGHPVEVLLSFPGVKFQIKATI
jgi:hypothetical protein